MPITTFQGVIANQSTTLVNARELHTRLQISTPFHKWIQRRINDYEFTENLDFIERTNLSARGFFQVDIKDYDLTLDMAKELCMLERSELGRQARRYFIQMEKTAQTELPRLQAENMALKKQLQGIPHFMRDPDLQLRLVQQATTALFLAQPECKEIVRYREMGLSNPEISKLLNLGQFALENRLRKLFDLGVLVVQWTRRPHLGVFSGSLGCQRSLFTTRCTTSTQTTA